MDTKKNIDLLKQKALEGDPVSQNALGCAYGLGDGVPKDFSKAFTWFERAAAQGYKISQFNVGLYYQNGLGVKKNIKKAVCYYEKAANQKYGQAANALGLLYEKGYHPTALESLPNSEHHVDYFSSNSEEAFYWFYEGRYSYDCCYNLARCYEEGIGIPVNLRKAREYYLIATQKGKNIDKARERLESMSRKYNPLTDIALGKIDLILNNPFRILGLWSNSSEEEIGERLNKITAFHNVGKVPVFDIDHIIPCTSEDYIEYYHLEIERNIEALKNNSGDEDKTKVVKDLLDYAQQFLQKWEKINQLEPQWNESPLRDVENLSKINKLISNSSDRIKSSLFWFCNITTTDDRCISILKEHKWDYAIGLWRREQNFSANLNLAVLCFAKRGYEAAVKYILTVIHNDTQRKQFLSAVSKEEMTMTETQLAHLFWDALFEFPQTELSWLDINNFLQSFMVKDLITNDDVNYIKTKTFNILSSTLVNELAKADKINRTEFQQCVDAYYNILKIAPYELLKIKRFLGEQDLRYRRLCDLLASSLSDYANYNNNENKEDWSAASASLNFASFAEKITYDKCLRERCSREIIIYKENHRILSTHKLLDIIDEDISNVDTDVCMFKDIKSLIQKLDLSLQCVATENGTNSEIYLKVVNYVVNQVIDLTAKTYNRNPKADGAAYSSRKILKSLERYNVDEVTRERLNTSIDLMNKAFKAGFYDNDTELPKKFGSNYTEKRNKLRLIKKIILSILCLFLCITLFLNLEDFVCSNELATTRSWSFYISIISLIIIFLFFMLMWIMEFQTNPYDTQFKWIDNIVDKLLNISNRILGAGVIGKRTFSGPFALPFGFLGLLIFVLSFPLKWIAKIIAKL